MKTYDNFVFIIEREQRKFLYIYKYKKCIKIYSLYNFLHEGSLQCKGSFQTQHISFDTYERIFFS